MSTYAWIAQPVLAEPGQTLQVEAPVNVPEEARRAIVAALANVERYPSPPFQELL